MPICHAIMLIPSVLFLLRRKEIWMQKNTWPLRNGCRILCSSPFLGAQKGMTLIPFALTHPPLINDRSLNTPHQRHYSCYLVISAFWGGVVKDCQAPFSPIYVRLKNVWGLMLLLVVVYLQVLWNLILVPILCKLDTLAQFSRFVSINAIAFKSFFSPYDQKSVL